MGLTGEHLPLGLLVAAAEGRAALPADARAHLAACARCAADMAWAERLLALTRDASDDEPPARAVARIKALFRERRAVRPPGLVEAVLRFDSARSAPAFGLRGDAARERQLLLSAGGDDLDLRVAPVEGGWAVSGQILPNAGPGWAELLGAHGWARAELSALGEFALAPVRAGRYNLSLGLGERTIVVRGLELGA
ncbi:MAG TPA: hypothetical protein PKD53_24400 [Chloroflexaceae bacterium]|nr:hypothetical protein [Chloroflexaceae bacterium]